MHWNEKTFRAILSMSDHLWRLGLSYILPYFLVLYGMCAVTMDQAPSFPWVTPPSYLVPNSVGRSCQTAYAGKLGEMLLMTLGYNYPLCFTPTHSSFLVHSCHIHSRSSSFLFKNSLDLLIRNCNASDHFFCASLKVNIWTCFCPNVIYLIWAAPRIKKSPLQRTKTQQHDTHKS